MLNFIFFDTFKNHFKTGHNMNETVPSSLLLSILFDINGIFQTIEKAIFDMSFTSSNADKDPINSGPGLQCHRPRLVRRIICQRKIVNVTITPEESNERAIGGGLLRILYDQG